MRKILNTYLPASMFLAFMAMVLLTCGGGGGGGDGSSKTLTGLSINGPPSMSEYGSATYTATANWDDNTTSTVTPDWSVNLQMASISPGGVLSCAGIDADQAVTITASYSSGGVTETDTMDVTVTNVATIPFTAQMVSGQALFEESSPGGGVYESTLSILNADFSFDQYSNEGPPPPDTMDGTSDYVTGTWSIDTYGNLVVDISGQETVTVGLISDSSTEIQAVVADGTEPPPMVTLEKIVPVDPAKLPGTYTGNDGYTWVFNADQTGAVPDFPGGGLTFTWSVDSEGVLRMPADTGYTASLYVRATTQSTATEYTVLKAAFPEHNTSTGNFYFYYGGIELTRQGGAPPPAATPTNLSINGPSMISASGTATYTATLTMSNGSTSMVTPTWSVNSSRVSISPFGELSCTGVDSDLTVTITATYSSEEITETDSMNVTVTNNTWGFQLRGPRGLHFEEDIDADGGYHSYLYSFNTDSSFERYRYENPPDTSDLVTGSWSINAEGKLVLTLPGQGTITVTRLADPFIVSHVLIDDGTGTPYNTTWEWTGPGPYPFDESLIPGTYVNQFGDTWIFNANGTGSTTGDGGWTYTWSVDNDGILKVVFPNGYVGSMYERPGSHSSATSYTIIEWAFVLNTPTSEFFSYYGGMRLIRQ